VKIEIVTSKQFKGQIQGTFNRPIISICRTQTGFRTFYLKYARTDKFPKSGRLPGWVKKVELNEELEHFIKHVNTFNVSNFLNSVLKEIPISWGIKDETISYIERFLTSENRIERIQKQVTDYIQYLPFKR